MEDWRKYITNVDGPHLPPKAQRKNVADDNLLTATIKGACLSFIYPSIALLWIYALLTTGSGFPYGASLGVVMYGMVISVVLGICLIINTIIALVAKRRYCHDPTVYHMATKNARLALIPPIYVSTMLIPLLFVL